MDSMSGEQVLKERKTKMALRLSSIVETITDIVIELEELEVERGDQQKLNNIMSTIETIINRYES